jgi:hypothetical protein
VRALVKWWMRVAQQQPHQPELAEIIYQDAVDIFCRIIPDNNIRTCIA